MNPYPISAVIITKNEAKNIARCLASLSLVDEILVLDTGSTDDTLEICKRYQCNVHTSDWHGFGKAKGKAVQLARHDIILSIDADEELSPALQNEIKALGSTGLGGYAYRIKRLSYYIGKPIHFCGWQKDQPLRMFDRRHGGFNDKAVHESIITTSPKKTLQNVMHHYTYPTLESHFTKMRFYAELAAGEAIEKGKTSDPLSPYLRAGLKFLKMYFLRFGFLDGYHGFLLCKNSTWGIWYKYHLIWKRKR